MKKLLSIRNICRETLMNVRHFHIIIWVIYMKMALVFHKITRKPLNIITKLQS